MAGIHSFAQKSSAHHCLTSSSSDTRTLGQTYYSTIRGEAACVPIFFLEEASRGRGLLNLTRSPPIYNPFR